MLKKDDIGKLVNFNNEKWEDEMKLRMELNKTKKFDYLNILEQQVLNKKNNIAV